MDSSSINHCPRSIPIPISILFSGGKDAGVLSLLNNHDFNVQGSHSCNIFESVFDCCNLRLDNLVKLTPGDTIAEVNYILWKGFVGALVFKEEATAILSGS